MKVTITYIYHSCFVLTTPFHTIVFDIPKEPHLNKEHKKLLQMHLHNKNALLFFSHSHEDHFNPNLRALIKTCKKAQVVVSFDIGGLFGDILPPDAIVVEPEEKYEVDGIGIETLESNDLGVAYLLQYRGRKIYYGGDLALWIWPDTPQQAREVISDYFSEVLQILKKEKIDIGFSNWDPRIDHLAGGMDFVTKVNPKVFVPMHTFGKHEILTSLKKSSPPTTMPFIYEKCGDSIEFFL